MRSLATFGLILLMVLVSAISKAQIGGNQSFEFLNLPSSAKVAGLGGNNISLFDNNVNMFNANPALLNNKHNGIASASYSILPGSIGFSNVSYAHNFDSVGIFGASVQYLDYGLIQGYDETGLPTTDFRPKEYAVTISHARQANQFRFGISTKVAGSYYGEATATALLFDIGSAFIHPYKDFIVALTINNIGLMLSDFNPVVQSKLPFDVRVGTSIKPEHMPVRFSVTIANLNHWNLINNAIYEDQRLYFFNNTFSHVKIGSEFILSKQVSILLGYNHLLRQEMRLESNVEFSGITMGLHIGVKAFNFSYALGGFHKAGNMHSFSFIIDLEKLIKKGV